MEGLCPNTSSMRTNQGQVAALGFPLVPSSVPGYLQSRQLFSANYLCMGKTHNICFHIIIQTCTYFVFFFRLTCFFLAWWVSTLPCRPIFSRIVLNTEKQEKGSTQDHWQMADLLFFCLLIIIALLPSSRGWMFLPGEEVAILRPESNEQLCLLLAPWNKMKCKRCFVLCKQKRMVLI